MSDSFVELKSAYVSNVVGTTDNVYVKISAAIGRGFRSFLVWKDIQREFYPDRYEDASGFNFGLFIGTVKLFLEGKNAEERKWNPLESVMFDPKFETVYDLMGKFLECDCRYHHVAGEESFCIDLSNNCFCECKPPMWFTIGELVSGNIEKLKNFESHDHCTDCNCPIMCNYGYEIDPHDSSPCSKIFKKCDMCDGLNDLYYKVLAHPLFEIDKS